MTGADAAPFLVAGGGIAGLTVALALAARGLPVHVFERTPEFREIGAGLQLSPNATRLLDRLGVLDDLRPVSVTPEAVVLRDASTLRELARVPLGDFAARRWRAPYLVVHRAGLQNALLTAATRQHGIQISTNCDLHHFSIDQHGIDAEVDRASGIEQVSGRMVIGADGVWSALRAKFGGGQAARFAGYVAWRRTFKASDPIVLDLFRELVVSAFLHPGFHLIAYPIRAGSELNVVAFTPAEDNGAQDWSIAARFDDLKQALSAAGPLKALANDEHTWTAWPVHTVDRLPSWASGGRLALIGDAAHAMTPFAAQGAAMAIEDAYTLAEYVARAQGDLDTALGAWQAPRRRRIARVAGRGAFNRFVWHAGGPVAWSRDLALRLRSPARLAADLDWLYGWEP